MEFRILGPLEVLDEGRAITLAGSRQRALLALLLLHANETLSTDRLIDELWGERPPANAAKTVQMQISRLRKALAGEAGNGGAGVIVTRERGYELRLDPGRLDAHRFERLVAEGRSDLAGGQAGRAVSALERALSLWRGAPLAELAYEPFAHREIARLDDLRVAALEQLIEAKLALGAHAEVVGQLEALIGEHPYRERLRAQLMLALYRSDRQADALQAYQDARRTLVAELGIEPGERLRELERSILAQDPGLHLAAEQLAAEPAVETPRGFFVGRDPELAELLAGLDDAFAGHGRLFLLVGEPGIGKSRLAEELIAQARALGALVLVGRCWEAGGAPAYWPWVQSLRPYLRDTDADRLRSQLREGAGDAARLLPELRELIADLPPVPPVESEGARFRLFDSVTAFLKRVASTQPLVLVLDDLHAADEPSLLLLRFVARELGDSRLLIVGAYRDVDPTLADPLTTTLTELAREPVTRTLALAGLGEADVARFIELAAPAASAAELAPAVHAETEGNPLFVGEIVRLLAAERRLNEPARAPLAIPHSVREVIGRRLRRLSDECTRLLTLASVLGREFDLDALAGVSGLERDAILELLDEATEARVVAEAPGAIGRMRFAHALIRDAAYHRLTRSGRVQLHRQAGEALEVLYASDLDPHLAELAHHFYESAAGGNGQQAVDYARRAAEQAGRLLAYEESARLYQMALAALAAKETPDETTRCELLLELGDAQARSGDMASAKETFARAADVARKLSLPELVARAAIGYGGRFVWLRSGGDRRLVPLLQDALAALPEDDSVLRVKLLARLAGALRDQPSPRPIASISREAVDMATRLADPGTLAYALDSVYAGITYPQQAAEWRAIADQLVQAAEAAGDKERGFDGHQHRVGVSLLQGDLDRADAELRAMARLADDLRQPAQTWGLALTQTARALFAGRFQEAEALIERTRDMGRSAQTPDVSFLGTQILQLFVLRREQSRLEEVKPALERFLDDHPGLVVYQCALAAVHIEVGRHMDARRSFEALATHGFTDLASKQEWFFGAGLLAEVCAALGDRRRAAILYDLLLPYADCNQLNYAEICCGSTFRYLGLLATTMSRWQDAERHFQAAIEMDRRTGGRPWLAHSQADYARMLTARGEPGDGEKARDLIASARATYGQLGMHTRTARASALGGGATRQAAHR
jgi:DNA-binding SARP family transcriptional activator/tetratricopeptide (TPR) repeat protein